MPLHAPAGKPDIEIYAKDGKVFVVDATLATRHQILIAEMRRLRKHNLSLGFSCNKMLVTLIPTEILVEDIEVTDAFSLAQGLMSESSAEPISYSKIVKNFILELIRAKSTIADAESFKL